ncbi:uncharacterized protein [Miscanthus floridulus]|uniref:uncharacterized protein n=1 Tax=Miscanthus floridulus TaxID=154761 RepID=UPI00345A3D23
MDFIEGLPTSDHYNGLLVVIDKLSKYGHFIPLKHPFTALQVAQLFMNHVYKLHGLPKTIISYRDRTNGQTERLNQCVEGGNGANGYRWQNSGITLGYISFGQITIRGPLLRAQQRMKSQADKKRSEREFAEGDLRIGKVAYKLDLPVDAKIHLVVHVSQLKGHVPPSTPVSTDLDTVSSDPDRVLWPQKILEQRSILRGAKDSTQLLVQWHGLPADMATWEDADCISKHLSVDTV